MANNGDSSSGVDESRKRMDRVQRVRNSPGNKKTKKKEDIMDLQSFGEHVAKTLWRAKTNTSRPVS